MRVDVWQFVYRYLEAVNDYFPAPVVLILDEDIVCQKVGSFLKHGLDNLTAACVLFKSGVTLPLNLEAVIKLRRLTY